MQDQLPSDTPNVATPTAEESATAATPATPESPAVPSQESPTVTTSPTTPVSKREVKIADAAPAATETTVNPVPEQLKVEVKVEEPEPPPLEPPVEVSNDQWQQILQRVNNFLNVPSDSLTEFFEKYKQPLVSIGLILLIFVSIKLLSGLLDAVNDIPLIAPTFELIGLGYSAWFVYRYLLSAKNRQELSRLSKVVKEYVFGKDNTTT